MEEAENNPVGALAEDGCAEDSSLQAVIDEAKTLARITNSLPNCDIVDFRFLRAAVKKP
jgi:hypothetical protein